MSHPRADFDPAVLKGPWSESGYVTIMGGALHWASVGTGKNLVLMPKLGGRIQDWNQVAANLSDTYRVIAIDPPGHGGSRMNSDPPYIVSQFQSASAVMSVLDMLGVDKFSAAGNSMGAILLLIAAAFWPERVTSLAMISAALPMSKTVAQIRAEEKDRNGIRGIYDSEFSYKNVNDVFALSKETYLEFKVSQEIAGKWKNPSARGVELAGPVNYLARASIPKLLIYGEHGTTYHKFIPGALAASPDTKVVTVKGCGSFVHQEKPEELSEILRDFLSGTEHET